MGHVHEDPASSLKFSTCLEKQDCGLSILYMRFSQNRCFAAWLLHELVTLKADGDEKTTFFKTKVGKVIPFSNNQPSQFFQTWSLHVWIV